MTSNAETISHIDNMDALDSGLSKEFLTIFIDNQMFGIPVLQIQDVLGEQKVTKIPLASSEISGALNLRGRIVTAINVRVKLGLPDLPKDKKRMSVVVEHENELYSLTIDKVGDVLSLENKYFEQHPATLDKIWKDISSGIYRLDGQLLVVLDVPKLLGNLHENQND